VRAICYFILCGKRNTKPFDVICAIVVAYIGRTECRLLSFNPFSHFPFSNVYGVTLTIPRHPRNGGGRGGPAEGSGQTLKAGRSFRPTNPFGILLIFNAF